jgi:hypothetical protein
MTGAGCGIADVNLPQHSIKWREKSGLAASAGPVCRGRFIRDGFAIIAGRAALRVCRIGPGGKGAAPELTRLAGQLYLACARILKGRTP